MEKGLKSKVNIINDVSGLDFDKNSIQIIDLVQTLEMANAALFLASDEASMITGITLAIDGGITAA